MSHHHRMHPYNMSAGKHNHPQDTPAPEEDLPVVEEQPQTDNAQTDDSDTVNPAEDCGQVKEAAEEAAKKELEEERLRMAAEMDNFKKRLTREHQEQMRYASEKVLADILPALDNLDLALQYASENQACSDMTQGIEMTRKLLLEAIEKHGLVSVGLPGEMFNPAIHEAIGMDSTPDYEKGAVTRVMQRGYKLNDRLLRPAKVMVNN